MSWDPTTVAALADVAHRGIVRCGIHGAIIIDRRCSACDAVRHLVLCCECLRMRPADQMRDREQGWVCLACSPDETDQNTNQRSTNA